MKNWLYQTFIAKRIAAFFTGIKGGKTQWGTGIAIALTLAKYFAPIPKEYLPYIDDIILTVLGATGVSFGDKVRRNVEIAKAITDDLLNKIPVTPEPPQP